MATLSQFKKTPSSWRKSLRRNNRNSRLVIICFFSIYACIGLLIDAFLYSSQYPHASISQLMYNLITFNLIPTATFIFLIIAGVSLLITYKMHDKLMLMGTNAREITPKTAQTLVEKQLYNVIEEMKVAAGLRFMPRVFILDEDYMNAFASGYSEKSAIVAITRGLLEKLDRSELTAVMAHELSHIRHLDIKLTLMASILANIMLLTVDLLFYNTLYTRRRSSESGNSLFAIIMILRILLPIITILLTLFLSRSREYMADAGSVQLMRDNEPMARALLKIHQDHVQHKNQYSYDYQNHPSDNLRRNAYLFDPKQAGIVMFSSVSGLFSTHPSLEKRLKALGFKPPGNS